MSSGRNEFVLFANYGREFLKLKYKVDNEFGYQGPYYWVGGKCYHFSPKWLRLMVDRFNAINGSLNVELMTFFDLLEGRNEPDEPEYKIFEVGGNAVYDPPFCKYLPEMIETPNFEDQLIRVRQTRTGTRLGGKVDPQTGKWVFPDGPPQGWRYNSDRGLWEEDF